MKDFFSKNQQKVAIVLGYIMVFMLAFGLGRITVLRPVPPEIRVEEPTSDPQPNSTAEVQGLQSQAAQTAVPKASPTLYSSGFAPVGSSCNGKIKGSSSHIYHLPGGAFYERTTKPSWCFNTETEAKATGFRKSAR